LASSCSCVVWHSWPPLCCGACGHGVVPSRPPALPRNRPLILPRIQPPIPSPIQPPSRPLTRQRLPRFPATTTPESTEPSLPARSTECAHQYCRWSSRIVSRRTMSSRTRGGCLENVGRRAPCGCASSLTVASPSASCSSPSSDPCPGTQEAMQDPPDDNP